MHLLFNPFLIPIVAILAFAVWMMIDAISRRTAEVRKHRADVELKIILAQRGMSADEILRVVSAPVAPEVASADAAPANQLPSGVPAPPWKESQAF
jgi:hypothetical protein